MDIVNREPECSKPLGELKPGPERTIFYQLPWTEDVIPKPSSSQSSTPMQMEYISMPFNGKVWAEVKNLASKQIRTSQQLIDSIKSTNPSLKRFSFNILKQVVDEMNESEQKIFYDETFPFIISSALALPDLIIQPIPILKQKMNHSLFFSQQQCASLLANAFLCTFDKPTKSKLNHFTFTELFTVMRPGATKRKLEKLKCIINYFRRLSRNTPKGTVTFERRYLEAKKTPDWSSSESSLKRLIVNNNGSIEKDGIGMLQVDFAHKLIGGKVLTYGMVQEEIRFVVSPELIVSMLFTETMLENEAIHIIGTEQFNDYAGYSDTFSMAGDHFDSRPLDEWGRRFTKVVAMDAVYFAVDRVITQYSKKYLDRELTKAYVAFMENDEIDEKHRSAIATGNWGCGVYRGDPQFKSLIQLIAASMCHRDLVYFTFKDKRLSNFESFIAGLESEKITSGQLYNDLIEYGNYVSTLVSRQNREQVFDYLQRKFKSK
ncbi:poly(ADP-ribose) glycohydrolase isoform X2 [Tetranychus urticae]|uniref:poly(ADP-ribose) glycohydrolase n=2 Tax=Tetranychus urticae TaxID=32264 RepID=T1JUS3_TETUR|nr:poly(ADP-ribose) glycohydrolase isoform X2 [Tetranychus urticae]